MILKEFKESPWVNWITREDPDAFKDLSDYDKICEMAVHSYDLTKKTRKMDHVDRIQFFVEWWWKNIHRMKKYKSYSAISRLLKKDHASIMYHNTLDENNVVKRKKSHKFNENVACIKDFLES